MAVHLTGLLVCVDDVQDRIVREYLPRHVALTRAEPGCVSFTVEPAHEPLHWDVSETFADADSFRAHQARVATSEWGAATAGIERRYRVDGLNE
jgi:quinol monooxygenase YgiN